MYMYMYILQMCTVWIQGMFTLYTCTCTCNMHIVHVHVTCTLYMYMCIYTCCSLQLTDNLLRHFQINMYSQSVPGTEAVKCISTRPVQSPLRALSPLQSPWRTPRPVQSPLWTLSPVQCPWRTPGPVQSPLWTGGEGRHCGTLNPLTPSASSCLT